jgi:formylglycine-generating enzyme required for sulfatase activity
MINNGEKSMDETVNISVVSKVYLTHDISPAGIISVYEASQAVGSKAPNSLGFYDMSGNVGEMCWDFHGAYSGEYQTDPVGASSGGYHVGRGGCWYYDVQYLRTSFRAYIEPGTHYHMVGFRIARSGL